MRNNNQSVLKQETVKLKTLFVGIDIAKYIHFARFVDYFGMEYCKAIDC
jgi:hypothetical protein